MDFAKVYRAFCENTLNQRHARIITLRIAHHLNDIGTKRMTKPADDAPRTSLRFRSDLFAIRLWREGSGEDEQWHGQLEHLASGQSRHFHDWDSFVAGLTELSGQK